MQAFRHLAALVQLALGLEEPKDTEDVEGEEVPATLLDNVKASLRSLPLQYYSMALSPMEVDGEVAVGDLADDLLDIYLDLKRGLLLWESGACLEAQWEWHYSFHHHWGAHAVQAMGCLHAQLHAYLND